jgi:hypothetical protein
MEKGNTVGVTVVVEDTPNKRRTIEAPSRSTVALYISHDAVAIVRRMFLTTPSLHPPLRAYLLSNGYAWVLDGHAPKFPGNSVRTAAGEGRGGYPIG